MYPFCPYTKQGPILKTPPKEGQKGRGPNSRPILRTYAQQGWQPCLPGNSKVAPSWVAFHGPQPEKHDKPQKELHWRIQVGRSERWLASPGSSFAAFALRYSVVNGVRRISGVSYLRRQPFPVYRYRDIRSKLVPNTAKLYLAWLLGLYAIILGYVDPLGS